MNIFIKSNDHPFIRWFTEFKVTFHHSFFCCCCFKFSFFHTKNNVFISIYMPEKNTFINIRKREREKMKFCKMSMDYDCIFITFVNGKWFLF